MGSTRLAAHQAQPCAATSPYSRSVPLAASSQTQRRWFGAVHGRHHASRQPTPWAADAFPPAALGDGWTPGFGARVRVEPCGDTLCGRIVWLWDDSARVAADKAPLLGRLYNPEDGRDDQGRLRLKSDDKLEVQGCIGPFCQTQLRRHADEQRCPPLAR